MANPIKVVLQNEVTHLGQSGDVVRVRPGYARNFLIPRGLAAPATAGNLARVEELKAKAREQTIKLKGEAEELKKKLEGVSIKISRQVGEENKMYGSVTSRDIEEAFEKAHGLRFDRRKLQLPDAIRTLGLSEVPLQLFSGVTATLRVEVIKES
ncbi:MAG TPA: 50S ribosomal protein L9 [Polyangiaceae bacterium]|nr:50S ribosomal protein L9 [Polyangiaceae bacterium]